MTVVDCFVIGLSHRLLGALLCFAFREDAGREHVVTWYIRGVKPGGYTLKPVGTRGNQELFHPYMRKITWWLSQLPVKGTQFVVHVL